MSTEPVKKEKTKKTAAPDKSEVEVVKVSAQAMAKKRFWMYLAFSGVFFVIFVTTLVLCLHFGANYKNQVDQHNEYMELIEYAEEHAICNLKGTVTEYNIDENTGRFAVKYRVVSESSAGGQLDAYSPYVYTREQIERDFAIGTEIRVAVQGGALNQKTKSVNMNYADFDMSTYPPYQKSKVGFISMLVATGISCFAVCCFFGLSMQALARSKNDDLVEEMEVVEVVKPNGKRVTKK